jgi:hypothetical protein
MQYIGLGCMTLLYGGDHTHTDKEMIRKCPYQDVNTTHCTLVFFIVVIAAENNSLFIL